MNPHSLRLCARVLATALVLCAGALTQAQNPASLSAEPNPLQTQPAGLTVAVLDFAADTPGEPELGKQISETVTVMLTGEPGFRLVDRAALTRALQEAELNLSGVVDTDQAVKVGKIVGARILIAGKAFPIGKQLFITAKLIGTETSLVDGVIVKGPIESDVGECVVELAQKLATRLREVGPKLVASDRAIDPLPALKAKLADHARPKIAVIIPERHATAAAARATDPAVETEIKRLLIECGFSVQDVKQNELTDFARTMANKDPGSWPRELSGVDYVIAGEAFSEFAARIGNLVSCAGQAEINLIARADGQIHLAERTTERGVDLSENIAAKTALQKAGRTLGLKVLEHFAQVRQAESEK